MKKLLLSLSIACMTIGAWGAKAYHLPVTVTQSDGQPLTIIQFGDEDMNYVTTTDGVLLYQEGTTYYIATVDEYGELVNTSVLAHNAAPSVKSSSSVPRTRRNSSASRKSGCARLAVSV